MAYKAVVVGAGGISNAWFPPLIQEKVEIAGIVDLRLEAAKGKAERYKLDTMTSTDLTSVLKQTQPDFVVDLTVPEAHCEVACTAMKMDCHVIGEKPMAASMAEARRMVRVAEETGMLYMVSQSRRWNPRHEAIHKFLKSGKLGVVTTINCDFYLGVHFGGFREEMPSPLILDMSIHHFDLARYMSQLDPMAVYAKEFNPKGSWYKGDVAASCIFEMSNGVIFTYRGSWCAEGFTTSWEGNWRIIGERGTLLYENDELPMIQVLAGKPGVHLKDLPLPKATLKYSGMHGALREMLTFLRTGKRPQTECHDNIKSLAMVFGVVESSKRGRRMPVTGLEK